MNALLESFGSPCLFKGFEVEYLCLSPAETPKNSAKAPPALPPSALFEPAVYLVPGQGARSRVDGTLKTIWVSLAERSSRFHRFDLKRFDRLGRFKSKHTLGVTKTNMHNRQRIFSGMLQMLQAHFSVGPCWQSTRKTLSPTANWISVCWLALFIGFIFVIDASVWWLRRSLKTPHARSILPNIISGRAGGKFRRKQI